MVLWDGTVPVSWIASNSSFLILAAMNILTVSGRIHLFNTFKLAPSSINHQIFKFISNDTLIHVSDKMEEQHNSSSPSTVANEWLTNPTALSKMVTL